MGKTCLFGGGSAATGHKTLVNMIAVLLMLITGRLAATYNSGPGETTELLQAAAHSSTLGLRAQELGRADRGRQAVTLHTLLLLDGQEDLSHHAVDLPVLLTLLGSPQCSRIPVTADHLQWK